MNYLLGLTVKEPLTNQLFYQAALKQIDHFLALRREYHIQENHYLLIIKNGENTFHLPKNVSYLYSHLQSVIVNQHDGEIVRGLLQCLMMIKEQFPSKIEVQMQSEDERVHEWKEQANEELSRRLVTHLKILHSETKKREIQRGQIQDLLYILTAPLYPDYQSKLKMMAMKILSQVRTNPKIWSELPEKAIKVIDTIASDPTYQKQAIQILQKILQKQTQEEEERKKSSLMGKTQIQSIKSVIFQLKNTISLNRAMELLSKVRLVELNEKENRKIDQCVQTIGSKYLDGFYQFDQHLQAQFQLFYQEYWRQRGLKPPISIKNS